MDRIELNTLQADLTRDSEVATNALQLARDRIAEGTPSGLEGCAHHLARLFNVIEQLALRVAKLFENSIDDRRWHAELIRRMTLEVEGVRPALFPTALVQPLRELRGFRHVWTHAYDLELDRDKLVLLLKYADQVVPLLPELSRRFILGVAAMHEIEGT
ncbi:MAG: hypothetical protein ABIR71_07160 [Chthoniobacterales bacterium]